MIHELEAPRLYVVEWRSGPHEPWRHPTERMQDSVFPTMRAADEFAEKCDHGETRVVCWRREWTEYLPLAADVALAAPVVLEQQPEDPQHTGGLRSW